jgi:hypothetical protein
MPLGIMAMKDKAYRREQLLCDSSHYPFPEMMGMENSDFAFSQKIRQLKSCGHIPGICPHVRYGDNVMGNPYFFVTGFLNICHGLKGGDLYRKSLFG